MRISDWSSDVCSSDLGAKWLDIVRRAGGGPSARPVDHDGLAARVQLAVGLQFLQHPPRHLVRAAHQPRQFLARHAQLGSTEENTSELKSHMRSSHDVLCMKINHLLISTTNKHN